MLWIQNTQSQIRKVILREKIIFRVSLKDFWYKQGQREEREKEREKERERKKGRRRDIEREWEIRERERKRGERDREVKGIERWMG